MRTIQFKDGDIDIAGFDLSDRLLVKSRLQLLFEEYYTDCNVDFPDELVYFVNDVLGNKIYFIDPVEFTIMVDDCVDKQDKVITLTPSWVY